MALPVIGLKRSSDRDGNPTGGKHQGFDLYTHGDRSVVAAVAGRVLRIVDARLPAGVEMPRDARERAGPFWVDVVELSPSGAAPAVHRYLHLDQVRAELRPGSILAKGERIGTFWATTYGGEEGHLHYEVRAHDWASGTYGEVLDVRKFFNT